MNRLEWPFGGSGNLEVPWPSAKCATASSAWAFYNDIMRKLAMKLSALTSPSMPFYVTTSAAL
jgi:hypothetical protein